MGGGVEAGNRGVGKVGNDFEIRCVNMGGQPGNEDILYIEISVVQVVSRVAPLWVGHKMGQSETGIAG